MKRLESLCVRAEPERVTSLHPANSLFFQFSIKVKECYTYDKRRNYSYSYERQLFTNDPIQYQNDPNAKRGENKYQKQRSPARFHVLPFRLFLFPHTSLLLTQWQKWKISSTFHFPKAEPSALLQTSTDCFYAL